MQLSSHKKTVQEHFSRHAGDRLHYREKNAYYYQCQEATYRFLIPRGSRVLELGCGTGDLLATLEPSFGVGVDLCGEMLEQAEKRFPQLQFLHGDAEDPTTWDIDATFDFIILSDLTGQLEDIQVAFRNLHPYLAEGGRIIISFYNFLWAPLFRLAEKLRLKMPVPQQNWLSPHDIENFLNLAGFDVVKQEQRMAVPKKVPMLSKALNAAASFPLLNKLGISIYTVARPKPQPAKTEPSVSVIIPCRNERGNIEPAITRMPRLGSSMEVIFIDGHSEDGTPEEIRRVIESHPEWDIRFLVQDGQGKGDAVRKAFSHARKDILMILDADLTVPPEDLPKFYDAIASGQGEYINGSRLVYTMEDEAMRPLNLLGNKFFSMVFSWLLNQRIKDTLCGTKVLSREHYQALAENRDYFGDFDPFGDFDLLFGAAKLNLKFVEIPIRYQARTYGETQISRFRHGWLLLKMSAFAVRKLKTYGY